MEALIGSFTVRRYLLPSLLLLICAGARAQEFTVYDNGLIYDTSTVRVLHRIVDSLHLKFKYCDPPRTFYSHYQTCGHQITLSHPQIDLDRIMDAMDRNASYEAVLAIYPGAVSFAGKDMLIIKQEGVSYEGDSVVRLYAPQSQRGLTIDIPCSDESRSGNKVAGRWIYEAYTPPDDGSRQITAYYLLDDFTRKPLPEKYARLIQYADCLVDTTTEVMIEVEESDQGDFTRALDRLRPFLAEVPWPEPYDYASSNEHEAAVVNWWHARYTLADTGLRQRRTFLKMLADVAELGIRNCCSDGDLEGLVAQYISKELALELKRRRQVIGSCSMDDGPRMHAQQIALLAAETARWEVFLRAHLNIMNDRFARMTDGSYAWKERKTYIRELESLDINVLDLLFGVSFRMENPSNNHYHGSIGRMGRAISESKQRKEFESRIVEMMKDTALDDYNRLIMFYLYASYLHELDDRTIRDARLAELRKGSAGLSNYIRTELADLKFRDDDR